MKYFKLLCFGTYEVQYFIPNIRRNKAAFPDSTAITLNLGQESQNVTIPIDS